MTVFRRFDYTDAASIRQDIAAMSLDIGWQDDLSPLARAVPVGGLYAPNALAVLPMEGCDSEPDGSPSALVKRRYERFSGGGAGLLWYEACAVVVEGRANPLQMYLHDGNVDAFRELLEANRANARSKAGHRPLAVLQLTHSGRYARPVDKPAPMIPQHDPLLDPCVGIDERWEPVSDLYLDALQEKYVHAAILAREAGFDGVDIKACHRYLVSELLAAHTRPGRYGGSFENRSRFLLEVVRAIRGAVGPDFLLACRFNVFDAHPYPYGFGVDRSDCWVSDLDEPLRLVRLLVEAGVDLLSNSAGNPYFWFPQVTRPFDLPTIGGEVPTEHPLVSVARLFEFSRQIQKTAGSIPVVGNGYSWLRQFILQIGAANLAAGGVAFIGLGRQAFAYPDAPLAMLREGRLDPRRCCIACSKCTQIMRDRGRTGCVIRDAAVYAPLYREARKNAETGHESLVAPEPTEATPPRKVALVTGGSRGIGFGIVRQLVRDGFRVVINGVQPMSASQANFDLLEEAGAEYRFVQGSIGVAADRARIVEEAFAVWGRIDVLVNNAGVAPQMRADLLEMNEASFDRLIEINTKGTLFLTQRIARRMVAQEPVDGLRGVIVNITSISAEVSSTNRGEYCVAKAASSMVTTLFADRLAAENILVYEVRPGIIETDMTSGVRDKYDRLFADGVCPIARWGTPDDVAQAVSVFASGRLRYTTGQVLAVDGGFGIRRL